jgi:hypothetical protein
LVSANGGRGHRADGWFRTTRDLPVTASRRATAVGTRCTIVLAPLV